MQFGEIPMASLFFSCQYVIMVAYGKSNSGLRSIWTAFLVMIMQLLFVFVTVVPSGVCFSGHVQVSGSCSIELWPGLTNFLQNIPKNTRKSLHMLPLDSA